MKHLLLSALLLVGLWGQSSHAKLHATGKTAAGSTMHVLFTSGFTQDTISVSINNTPLVSKELATSDESTGTTPIYFDIINKGGECVAVVHKAKHQLKGSCTSLRIVVVVNAKRFAFEVEKRRGAYVYFSEGDKQLVMEQDVRPRAFD